EGPGRTPGGAAGRVAERAATRVARSAPDGVAGRAPARAARRNTVPTNDRFAGFSPDAFRFYAELHVDNSKAFWEANKQRYLESVRAPLGALARELEGAVGEWHMFRPYRDLRFTKDRRPYKEHQGLLFGGRGPSVTGGQYVQLSREGMYVGFGAYQMREDQLARYRRAVADDRAGGQLEEILAELTALGYVLEGETLKRAPQGFPLDHPRVALLKRKGVFAGADYEPAEWMYGPEALERIAKVFADGERLCAWLRAHVA